MVSVRVFLRNKNRNPATKKERKKAPDKTPSNSQNPIQMPRASTINPSAGPIAPFEIQLSNNSAVPGRIERKIAREAGESERREVCILEKNGMEIH